MAIAGDPDLIPVSVVIPTLRAGRYLRRLLPALAQQTLRPVEVLVIDSASEDDTRAVAEAYGARFVPIERADFDHGGTRNQGLSLTSAPVVVFLTQDALPADQHFLDRLTRPLRDGRAAAAYARQVPYPEANPLEVFARARNYPERDEQRRQSDRAFLGIRATFFSNVASAVLREEFIAAGGFPERTIMNEDVALCAALLERDRVVCYRAGARVQHSHNYSIAEQFRRYFDIGVYHALHPSTVAKAEGEGFRFVRDQLAWLHEQGQWGWMPRCVAETGAKYLAYRLGRAHQRLSRATCRRLSLHRGWWRRRL
jgi:rhamnosyltransferase